MGPGSQGATSTSANIYSISISGSQMVINGTNLGSYTQVSIEDPTTGNFKPFQVVSATSAQIISESINTISIPMDKALDLILSNASAQSTFPITFTLQPNSVDTDNLKDGSIINDKIRFRSITLNKLLPNLGSNPQPGEYVRWDGNDFILDPGPTSGGGGGASGTVTSINTGAGLLSSSNPITTIGTIIVDIGTAGAAAPTAKIPYFNVENKIVMDSTGLAPNFSGLRFKDGSNYFDIFNENALKIENNSGTELITLDYSGDLSVSGAITSAGSPVCTAAAPCGAAPGSGVTATPPLIASGTNISAQTGTSQGDLVLLGAPGAYPGVGKLPAVDGSSLLGVITDVLPGTATFVSKFLGNATVGVVFGDGAAQRWQRNLDNLGTLNPNDDYVIIGNGNSFEVQGGDTLLTSIGAQKANANLTDLGNLSPFLGNIIVGGGTSWIPQTIPNCPVSRVVLANGNNFSCSTITSNFSGGTITSNANIGMQIGAVVGGSGPTGEMRFSANDNTNYVGFKAPAIVPVNTMWTLPSADGTNGQVLSTNASGVLSWVTINASLADVVGPASSTTNAIAKFSNSSGKNLSNSGVLINATNDLSGIGALTSTGNMTVNTSTFLVDATNNNVGIGGSPVTVNGFGPTLLNVQASVSTNTFSSPVPVGLNLRNSANNTGYTPALIFSSSGNSNGPTSAIASNVTYNAALKEANLEFYTEADPEGLRKVMEFIGGTGNANITFGLTINNNGSNSSTFPTTRGTSGQALTTNGSGTLSWSTVGGTNDVSNATPTTANAIARFDGTTGKLIQNSGVIIDDSNNLSGIVNLTANGSLTINNNGSNSSTFPTGRGTNGQSITTNGSGTLSWASVGGPNDVSNAATSTDNSIARYDGTTGKLIQNSGVIISDTNSITGVASILSTGNIDAGQTSIGANTGLAGTWGCFSNNSFPNSSTSYSLCQDDTGTTILNAPAGQTVQARINNSAITTVNSTGLGIFMTPANALDVTGSIEATGQISSGAFTTTTNTLDWNNGNIISTNYNCAGNITFANLKIGGTYTLIDTDTGTALCNFSTTTTGTNAATVTYRFRPANTNRIASTHSIYTLMRVGNTVYVSWGSGF